MVKVAAPLVLRSVRLIEFDFSSRVDTSTGSRVLPVTMPISNVLVARWTP